MGSELNAGQPEETLYHYTSLESFIGIITTRQLWASHFRYLNDASEGRLLWDEARAGIEARLLVADDATQERLAAFQKLATNPPGHDIYVISFSQDGGDRLSQWRGYGGFGGVAIGFDTVKLRNKCPFTLNYASQLRPVVYIDPSGDRVSRAMVDNMIRTTKEHSFEQVVSFAAVGLKHIAFEEEQEWRILVYTTTGHVLDVGYRYRKSKLVPYVPFDLGNEIWQLISRVVVGPSPYQTETSAAIEMMTGGRIEVVKSRIPYRDW